MNAIVALKLVEKYSICPECGNDKLGNGAGTLVVGDHEFKRTCKCGWEVTVKEEDVE